MNNTSTLGSLAVSGLSGSGLSQAKTYENLSPATRALLCDEVEDLFATTDRQSCIPVSKVEVNSDAKQGSGGIAEGEILHQLAKGIHKLVANCKRRRIASMNEI